MGPDDGDRLNTGAAAFEATGAASNSPTTKTKTKTLLSKLLTILLVQALSFQIAKKNNLSTTHTTAPERYAINPIIH
jgi:hypothetical protein